MTLFQGQFVKLVAADAEADAPLMARWSHDTEFRRQLDSQPARMWITGELKGELEQELAAETHNVTFFIRTLAEDRPIGFVGLDGISWTHGEAFVGIGLGDPDYRGKGYGTDAMRVILRYAFVELNLHRVSLTVYEYNPRAIRSYEKNGFVAEGRQRGYLHRDGRRWDMLYMGILKEEWEKSQNLADPRSGAKGTNPKLHSEQTPEAALR